MMIYALGLLPLALACGPGSGPSTDTPTLTFNYSSPLSWTFYTKEPAKTVGGQSLNKDTAQNRINSDIEFAVIKAVESFGYSTAGVVVKNAIAPEDILIAEIGKCVADGFGQEDGVVTKTCGTATDLKDGTLHSHVSSITVKSPVALAQSQWENIATKVWATLTNNAGVKFYGLIDVALK